MDDAAHVRDTEGAGDIEPDAGRLPRRETAAAPESRRQVLPLDQGHDEVGPIAVGAGIEAGDDVGVAEHRLGERFAPESVGKVAVRRDFGSQDLDRDLPLGSGRRSRGGSWPSRLGR